MQLKEESSKQRVLLASRGARAALGAALVFSSACTTALRQPLEPQRLERTRTLNPVESATSPRRDFDFPIARREWEPATNGERRIDVVRVSLFDLIDAIAGKPARHRSRNESQPGPRELHEVRRFAPRNDAHRRSLADAPVVLITDAGR